jgi:hypothetical protein
MLVAKGLAEGAVGSKTVSHRQFPITGTNTGKFSSVGPFHPSRQAIQSQFNAFADASPANKQGINFIDQGVV